MVRVGEGTSFKKKADVWLWGHRALVGLGGVVMIMAITGGAYVAAYWGKIVPGVRIGRVDVGNMTGEEAVAKLERDNKEVLMGIKVSYGEKTWEVKPSDVEAKVNLPATVNKAWLVAREGGLMQRWSDAQEGFFRGIEVMAEINYDNQKLSQEVETMVGEIEIAEARPTVKIVKEGKEFKIEVDRGRDGLRADKDQVRKAIVDEWRELRFGGVEIGLREVRAAIDETTALKVEENAKSLLGKEMKLVVDKDSWEMGADELVSMVAVDGSLGFDQSKVIEAVSNLSKGIERQPSNAAFLFTNGKVEEFRPGIDGIAVNKEGLKEKILMAYGDLASEKEVVIEVPVSRTPPAIKTSQVNDLGIKELLGRGESSYKHSIPNRVDNVALAASRVNGVLVPPGETFSFNGNLGDVSASTGFKSAYVISGGRTVLGDGGGVCQVSTTLFRAALNAGLPIVERRAHAYRVSYYEEDSEPGIDATVFSPSPDFKFKNDTPGYLLIQSTVDSKNREMKYEIYGSSDGRKAEISKPKVWGQSPPPPALYQDDPTLPAGTTKQIDWAAWGAKVSFEYKVTRNGETIYQKTFDSIYRPWQAVYLRGTGGLASSQ